jgi:hypothetical protein
MRMPSQWEHLRTAPIGAAYGCKEPTPSIEPHASHCVCVITSEEFLKKSYGSIALQHEVRDILVMTPILLKVRSVNVKREHWPHGMEAGREGSVSEDGDVTGGAFTSWRLRKGSHLARHLIALAQDSFNRGKAH